MPQIPHIQLISSAVWSSAPGQALERVLARTADVIMNECAHARGVRGGERARDVGVLGGHALDGAGRPRLVGEEPVAPRDASRRESSVRMTRPLPHGAQSARWKSRLASKPPLRRSVSAARRCTACALRVRGARRRERGRGGLEQLAQLVQLAHVGGREALHERAAPRHEAHEALLLEQVQRLAHGRARHAELGRDLLLLDARVRRQPSARDRLAQRGEHAIGELLLIVEGGERHRRILYPIIGAACSLARRRRVSTTLTP